MFEIEFKPCALEQIKKIKRFYAVKIIRAIEKHLGVEPDKPGPPRIKKLRGHQKSAYRLREGNHRIFYDVGDVTVTIVAILHKSETAKFYQKE